jgi:hypothetical protein
MVEPAPLSRSQVLEAIAIWQSSRHTEPLGCAWTPSHPPLVAFDDGLRVVMRCVDCEYRLLDIPARVIDFYLRGIARRLDWQS